MHSNTMMSSHAQQLCKASCFHTYAYAYATLIQTNHTLCLCICYADPDHSPSLADQSSRVLIIGPTEKAIDTDYGINIISESSCLILLTSALPHRVFSSVPVCRRATTTGAVAVQTRADNDSSRLSKFRNELKQTCTAAEAS